MNLKLTREEAEIIEFHLSNAIDSTEDEHETNVMRDLITRVIKIQGD